MKSIFLIIASCLVALAAAGKWGHEGQPNGAAAFAWLTIEQKQCVVDKFIVDGTAINVSFKIILCHI